MVAAMLDPEVASACNQQRVVPVDVRLAVAGAVIDYGVVQYGAIAFRRIRHLGQEASQSIALELIVGSEVLHGFSA